MVDRMRCCTVRPRNGELWELCAAQSGLLAMDEIKGDMRAVLCILALALGTP